MLNQVVDVSKKNDVCVYIYKIVFILVKHLIELLTTHNYATHFLNHISCPIGPINSYSDYKRMPLIVIKKLHFVIYYLKR